MCSGKCLENFKYFLVFWNLPFDILTVYYLSTSECRSVRFGLHRVLMVIIILARYIYFEE